MATSTTWNANAPPYGKQDVAIADVTRYLFGDKFKGVNANISRAISLYRFLLAHRNMNASTLRPLILEDGKPLFSVAELTEILAVVRAQANMPFAKRLLVQQQGGGGAETKATEDAESEEESGSRGEFWDDFFVKLANPVVSRIPPKFDGLLWYMFFLSHMEELDFVGPLLSTALDSVTLSLPVMAELSQEVMGKLIALAPVPYASFAGEAVGYAISLLFIMTGIVLNTMRKKFGSAFKMALEAIPVFGDALMDAAQSFEIASQRYLKNRDKMIASLDKYSPHTANVVEYWTPTTELGGSAEPVYFDLDKVKTDLIDHAVEELGLEDAMSILENPVGALPLPLPGVPGANNLLKGAAGALPLPSVPGALPGANNLLKGAAGALPLPSVPSANSLLKGATNAASPKALSKLSGSRNLLKGTAKFPKMSGSRNLLKGAGRFTRRLRRRF